MGDSHCVPRAGQADRLLFAGGKQRQRSARRCKCRTVCERYGPWCSRRHFNPARRALRRTPSAAMVSAKRGIIQGSNTWRD